jgi:eukaryotic-like serine/threonine-protein kinase
MNTESTDILFDKFEIINCLKKDDQTGVYLANHIYLGKKIILKILDTGRLSDNSILERFKREAKILAKLNHPNVIKVLDFGTYKEFFYISFEHFESISLREVINKNNLPNDEKINLLVQLLKGLKAAHKDFIIHRDIKPENILVNSDLELKIADFGLALVKNENSLTNNSAILGTPTYMAPEQINGEKTFQTDIFSAGLVAFELFSGVNPVLGDEIAVTINNIINFNTENHKLEFEKLPEEVRRAIRLMLQNKIEDRAKSIDEVLGYLNQYGEPDNAGKKKYRRKKLIIWYAAAFTVIFILVLFFLVDKSNSPLKSISQNFPNTPKQLITENKKDKKETPRLKSEVQNSNGQKKLLLANREKTIEKNNSDTIGVQLPGKLFIDCYPWADVYIDNKKFDRTPLQNEIMLKPGKHIVKLIHPDYPPIIKNLDIVSQKTETIKINFNETVGFLVCNIYPWGKIYVDSSFVGITPLRKPIALLPGKHDIVVRNSQYESISRQITISAKKTFDFNYNFVKPN